MYGMMCVVYTTGIWLLLASFLELPVSTTHSTVGGIVGMAITYGGPDCVVWYEEADMFPYLKGVSAIVASWALSPVFSGIIALALFFSARTFILRSADPYKRLVISFPFLVMATIAVNGKYTTFVYLDPDYGLYNIYYLPPLRCRSVHTNKVSGEYTLIASVVIEILYHHRFPPLVRRLIVHIDHFSYYYYSNIEPFMPYQCSSSCTRARRVLMSTILPSRSLLPGPWALVPAAPFS